MSRAKKTTSEPSHLVVDWPTGSIRFPLSWHHVTLGQFLRFCRCDGSPLGVLSALSSDPALVAQIPDVNADKAIFTHLGYTRTLPDYLAQPVPTQVEINGQMVTIPQKLGLCTYGQKVAADEEIARVGGIERTEDDKALVHYDRMALGLLSIYLYPQLSGKPFIDTADTEVYHEAILALPAREAMPLTAFFLTSYKALTGSGVVSYRVEATTTPPLSRPGLWSRIWRITRPTS